MSEASTGKPFKCRGKHTRNHTKKSACSTVVDFVSDKFLTVCLLLAVCFCQPAVAEPSTWQTTDTIVEAATQAVTGAFHGHSGEYNIEIREPDSRLRLKRCQSPLSASPLSEFAGQQRVAIQVRCDDSPGWKIYVQANVRQFADVLVAGSNLPRGHILTRSDLDTKRMSLNTLAGGFVNDMAALVGRKLLRTVAAGSVLRPNDVRTLPAIKRGQSVDLVVRDSTIHIKMRGSAMADGVIGQRIMVENASSGRIVEGIVRSATTVEIP